MDLNKAKIEFDTNNYVVFKNAMPDLPESIFKNFYKNVVSVIDEFNHDYSSMQIAPDYFFQNAGVQEFYNKCIKMYTDPNTFYIFEATKGGKTERHSDRADVVHWQCSGKSVWTMYKGLVAFEDEGKNIEKESEEITLNAGDVIWFKSSQEHSVKSLTDKYSMIFMSNTDLKDFIKKQYDKAGIEFENKTGILNI